MNRTQTVMLACLVGGIIAAHGAELAKPVYKLPKGAETQIRSLVQKTIPGGKIETITPTGAQSAKVLVRHGSNGHLSSWLEIVGL